MATPREIREEQVRMVRLRVCVDLTSYRLRWTLLSRDEGLSLIERTREEILELFPETEDVFNLILRPRFLRLLNERAMEHWGVTDSVN